MKKLIPIIMFSIILFCTACEKKVDQNPLDIYDNVNVYTTFEELKALHTGTIISVNDERFAIKDCTNTAISDIVETYNSNCTVNISRSSIVNSDDTLNINTFAPGNIQKSDYDELISKLSKKYSAYTINKEEDITRIYLDYDKECRFAFITVFFTENNGISIDYKFHPKDFYKD